MPRIICLIQEMPPLIYFVNEIHRHHPIALVVVEATPKPKTLIQKLQRKGLRRSIHALIRKGRECLQNQSKKDRATYDRTFGPSWQIMNPTIEVLRTSSINSDLVLERLKQEKPDLLLDHGTNIVKDHILDTAPLALNLHWGLSPYYRGVFCTNWALLNGDVNNIGVTVHKLSKHIDGGDILAQKRTTVQAGDTVHSLNMRLTKLGTDLIIKIVYKIKGNERLEFKRQDFFLGKLKKSREWNEDLDAVINRIEKKHLTEGMLQNPSRREKLPIVEI